MASDKEFDILLNKYHTAIAKYKDLQEQLTTKQRQWQKQEEQYSVTEKLTRELCEDILAKEPSEMVLGRDYSWSSIPLNELILKSKRVFKNYCVKRTDLLRKTMDTSEQRLQTIESLQEQISIMRTSPTAASITQDELEKQIKKEKEKEAVVNALPYQTKKKIEAGNTAIILEDDDISSAFEDKILDDMADINAMIQVTPKSIPVSQSRKKVEQKRKRRKQKIMAHTVNLKEYENKMSEYDWCVLRIIGKYGFSRYQQIEEKFLEEQPDCSKSRSRIAITNLVNIGLANSEKVSNPLKGIFNVYQLTDMGGRIYSDRYNSPPVSSEMDLIMAEHDNCQHGYGIRMIAEVLREKGSFEEVSDKNRKHPIRIAEGVSYVPDIVCSGSSGQKMYIEYECANHTQHNFNAKCNKMTKVTSQLNFIVPNRSDMEKICSQVQEWIKNRGATSLRHITIRITGAAQIKDMDLLSNDGWKYVFTPGKSTEPVVNF